MQLVGEAKTDTEQTQKLEMFRILDLQEATSRSSGVDVKPRAS